MGVCVCVCVFVCELLRCELPAWGVVGRRREEARHDDGESERNEKTLTAFATPPTPQSSRHVRTPAARVHSTSTHTRSLCPPRAACVLPPPPQMRAPTATAPAALAAPPRTPRASLAHARAAAPSSRGAVRGRRALRPLAVAPPGGEGAAVVDAAAEERSRIQKMLDR